MRAAYPALRSACIARTFIAAITFAATATLLEAQAADRSAGADARLAARLDSATTAAVTTIIDSASAAGLPTGPLVVRALQGAIKRADGARIVGAVRALAAELGGARDALGDVDEAELVAGASALHAGAAPATLRRMRRSRPDRPLTIPLAVLADLVSAGVPADTAAQAVLALTARGAADDDFTALREDVGRDVARGAPPGAAAVLRTIDRPAARIPARPASPPSGRPAPSTPRP